MLMRFNLFDQLLRGEIGDHPLAASLAGHTRVWSGLGVHPRARIHHRNLRELMPTAELEVIEIMPGRDFYGAGAEFPIDRSIRDDRDYSLDQRQSYSPPCQVRVALV